MQKIAAVIFDMDGLLLDSERIALATFVDSCRACNFKPDLSVYYQCIGVNSTMTRQILIEGHSPDFPSETVFQNWKEKYQAEAIDKPVPLKAGAVSLLKHLNNEATRMAVVTSTHRDIALGKLTKSRVIHFFDFVLGGDQVGRSKPDPEIYLTACRKLNLAPSQCLALEDSDNGVLSAFNAGLTVIQIPDLKEPSQEVRSLGHRIVGSLAEVENILLTRQKYYA